MKNLRIATVNKELSKIQEGWKLVESYSPSEVDGKLYRYWYFWHPVHILNESIIGGHGGPLNDLTLEQYLDQFKYQVFENYENQR
tara:strand:- start:601 stop:855 length:255 start_codon:yes stop_codon:yes gene_type:complete